LTKLTDYQRYIHLSRYARYIENAGRRETWEETVKRYCDFWKEKYPDLFPYQVVYDAIVNMEVMPSMRAMMTAGPALDRDNVAGYNCAYIDVDHPRAFDEIMYILMCGTGVGYSVEREYVRKLPEVAEEMRDTDTTIVVGDSKIGWATALRELISLLYAGKVPRYDLSKVRPAGARLKTFGGRASGPGPLKDLFDYAIEAFRAAAGRRLNALEVSDLVCKIADAVIVGGVRRSALICLSNLTDERLRTAKSGNWWENFGHRANANISVAYSEMPDMNVFMQEWMALYESKSGERGIFNRVGAQAKAKLAGRRDWTFDFGTNPCGEIVLRPKEFCNLSEVVVRNLDDAADLERKVAVATIIGTFQSTLTNFRYLRPIWRKNVEEERLLGVSLTGIMDCPFLAGVPSTELLARLKEVAIEINKQWAEALGINPSVAITTIKPSGTVSQLVDSSSGIHPRHSPYYIRTVRADNKDPLCTFLKQQGVPHEPDVTKPEYVTIFSFPVRSPAGAVVRDDISAIEQLEHYLVFAKVWCEHNPSITVYVREHEWMDVGAWVFRHFKDLGGVSFLPYSEHVYKQAPYQECSEEFYNEALSKMPQTIHWEEFVEDVDSTVASQEFACVAGVCEI
jgi:ribonucleoside-triphosphate reductase (thioredoxin)